MKYFLISCSIGESGGGGVGVDAGGVVVVVGIVYFCGLKVWSSK